MIHGIISNSVGGAGQTQPQPRPLLYLAMASTPLASLSARATPRSRRGTFSTLVLPKIQVLSSSNATTGGAPSPTALETDSDDAKTLSPLNKGTQLQDDVSRLHGAGTGGLVTATIRELELEIDPVIKRNLRNIEIEAKEVEQTQYRQRFLYPDTNSKPVRRDRRVIDHERARIQTWPSLQYKVWLDTSNLSLHRLNTINRPMGRVSTTQQGNRNFSQSNLPSAQQELTKWSSDANKSSTLSAGPGEKETGAIKASLLDSTDELIVGSPEKWHVVSSHVLTDTYTKGTLQNYPRDNSARPRPRGNRYTGRIEYPRLPSRMGRNTFDSFLDNASGKISVQMRPRLPVKTGPLSTTVDSVPSHDSKTDPKMLKLKGLIRNPIEHKEKGKRVMISTKMEAIEERWRNIQRETDTRAKKTLSFKVTSGRGRHEVRGRGFVGTDMSSPPTPVDMEGTYHITRYIATKYH